MTSTPQEFCELTCRTANALGIKLRSCTPAKPFEHGFAYEWIMPNGRIVRGAAMPSQQSALHAACRTLAEKLS